MRRLLVRLIAFLGVFIVGLYFIGVDILNYHLGAQPFTVTVLVPAASGLYPGASVDYRGVVVGQVTSLDLSPTGVTIKLGINAGTRIPDNGVAEIKQLSALGEQYLDFQPSHAGGPYLQAGSVIPASRIVLPTPIGTALDNLSTLLNSVNGNDLQTFESWLTSAFIGTGPGLHQIITTGQELFNSLAAAQPETVNLIVDGNTDLHTLKATSGDFQTFAKGLASFTGQLVTSNGDLHDLINNASAAANTVGPFLASNNPTIAALIANFATDAHAANVYQPAVEALFQILPVVASRAAGALSGGTAHARGRLQHRPAGLRVRAGEPHPRPNAADRCRRARQRLLDQEPGHAPARGLQLAGRVKRMRRHATGPDSRPASALRARPADPCGLASPRALSPGCRVASARAHLVASPRPRPSTSHRSQLTASLRALEASRRSGCTRRSAGPPRSRAPTVRLPTPPSAAPSAG